MKLRKFFLPAAFTALLSVLLITCAQADDLTLSYELSFEEAQAHYADVEMNVSGLDREYVDVKMAVWAPGSYLIREFSKNVEGFEASAGEQDLRSEKISKNTWRVYTEGAGEVAITYRVYAFEVSVRTSFVNTDHAYLNGTSIFMFIDGELELPSTIQINPYTGWKKISTGLESDPGDPFILSSPNYDILADSPIEIGNQDIITFTAAGIPHEIAIYGGGNYDPDKLAEDFTKIIEEETRVFGENPCERYVFIVHFLASPGGGGLEHLNSTTLQFPGRALGSEKGWAAFMGLMAHEYFHLWNVKRLRPIALGPFDYERENYTHMLWVAEGFTAYYDNWMVRRTGFFSPEEYLQELAGTIGSVENTPGNRVQSVAAASFDAWIKYYRPNENSYNTTISYYSKGAILGMMIDMAIREHSKGEQTIDDLMKYLYEKFYKELGRGYKDEEFQEAVEKFAGDMDDFFEKYVRGTAPIPYNDYFDAVGLKLVKTSLEEQPLLGASLEEVEGNLVVTRVVRGTPAYEYGINVNDIILSVNGEEVSALDEYLKGKQPGDKLSVKVIREGVERTVEVVLGPNDNASYKLEKADSPSQQQQANYKAWLAV